MKRLYRSETNQMLGGVCGGIAEMMDIDPTIVRIVVAIGTIFTGIVPGIVIYAVACVVMPTKSQLPPQ